MISTTIFDSHRLRSAIAALTFALLSACGAGDGQGLDSDGNLLTDGGNDSGSSSDDGGGGSAGASGNPNARLAWVQTNVFGGVCTQCHTGAGAPLGVDWSSESATCSNLGRASGEIPSLMEIDSGNPANSYVVWKIDGAGPSGEAIVGAQMPLSNPPLTADAIQNIKDWISDGTPGCAAPRTAGKSTGSGPQPDGDDAAVSEGGKHAVSWPQVWETSLRLCSTCHGTTASNPACTAGLECPPRGLALGVDNYYGLMSSGTVVPFDPAASRLWRRLSTGDASQRMPLGYPPLNQDQLATVRDWILAGAPLEPAIPE